MCFVYTTAFVNNPTFGLARKVGDVTINNWLMCLHDFRTSALSQNGSVKSEGGYFFSFLKLLMNGCTNLLKATF